MTPTAVPQSGLFTQLQPLLVHRAVLITISKLEGDQLQVNICPRQLAQHRRRLGGGLSRCGWRRC
jgi:hypothetical protein